MTRSKAVIYFNIAPSRSGAVPGAHFAGLQERWVIIICDRYSAYKNLARLSEVIVLAFECAASTTVVGKLPDVGMAVAGEA